MQQINLYTHLKKTPRLFLTLEKILSLYGIFFLFLMCHLLFYAVDKSNLNFELNELKKTYNSKQALLGLTKQKYPEIGTSSLLGAMLQLEKEVSSKGQVLAIFSQNTRFSTIFLSLSKAIVPGVWLTEIKITESGQKIILTGKASQANFPQNFIEQLKHQTPFDKMQIQLNEITQSIDSKTENVESTFSVTADTIMEVKK